MAAVLGGLGAACMFALGTLCSSRSSRLIGPWSVLAWVMATGLVVNLIGLAAVGSPGHVDGSTVGWLATAGAGNVVGLLLAYSALRVGKVGLIAPILSTEGALAAVISVVDGEPLGVSSAWLLALIVSGVLLAASAPESVAVEGDRKWLAVLLAALAALAFAASLFSTGHISRTLDLPWVLLPPRLIGVVAITIPLLVTRRLRITRRALPLVVVGGLSEVFGFASFTLGARHGIAVAAVLSSQFAAIAGIAAFVLFRERLSRLQLGGVAMIVIGVAALSAVRS